MFDLVVADPNWAFTDKIGKRGTESLYGGMAVSEICALGPLIKAVTAPDCVLALWIVGSQVEEGIEVVKAWGFTQKQVWNWRKITVRGKQHFGMGRYRRAAKESVLFGVRGSMRPAVRNLRDDFDAAMPTWAADAVEGAPWPSGRYAHLQPEARGVYVHSAKPERLQDELEIMYPDSRGLELYARRARPGWTCLGNQCPGDGRDLVDSLHALGAS